MNDLVFERTRGQRRYDMAMIVICGSLAVLGLVLGLRSSDWLLSVLWFAAAGVMLLAVVAVPLERGQAIITLQGIQSVRPFRRRAWEWREITDIDVRVVQYRNTSRWVVIRTIGRKSFRLPAPYDFSVGGNPDFDQHVAAIRDKWFRATGRNM